MGTFILVALFAAVVVAIAVRRNQVQRAATVEVSADEHGVHRVLANGRREEVSWAEVTEVDVFTTGVGPHRASGGAVVLFGDAERGCLVPLDRLGESGLLEHVHHLRGFDPAAIVAAVREPEVDPRPAGMLASRPVPRTTVCWRRDGGAAGPEGGPGNDEA